LARIGFPSQNNITYRLSLLILNFDFAHQGDAIIFMTLKILKLKTKLVTYMVFQNLTAAILVPVGGF